MMRLRAVLAAVVVLALGPTAAADAAPVKKSCTAKGAKTVAKNRFVRIFKTGSRIEGRLFGCMYSNGRRVLLDKAYDDDYTSSESFQKVRLNGRFVAWEHEIFDISCKADCPPGFVSATYTVLTRDLRAKKNREFAGVVKGESLVLGKGGTPAWLEDGMGGVEVHAGSKVLEVGVIDSLRLRGTTLSWVNGGQARSVEFDVPPPTRAQRRACAASGSTTLAANNHARVFTTTVSSSRTDVTGRLFGCHYSKGRRVLLDEASNDGHTLSETFSQVRLNGRFVAWQDEYYDISCKAGCPPGYDPLHQTIKVADLRSRRDDGTPGAARDGTLAVDSRGTATWVDVGTGEPRSFTLR